MNNFNLADMKLVFFSTNAAKVSIKFKKIIFQKNTKETDHENCLFQKKSLWSLKKKKLRKVWRLYQFHCIIKGTLLKSPSLLLAVKRNTTNVRLSRKEIAIEKLKELWKLKGSNIFYQSFPVWASLIIKRCIARGWSA